MRFYSSVILNSTETGKKSAISISVFYSSVILNSTETKDDDGDKPDIVLQ